MIKDSGLKTKHRVKNELFKSWKVSISDASVKTAIFCRKPDIGPIEVINRVKRLRRIVMDYRNNHNLII